MGIKFFDWLKRGSVSAAPAEVTIDQVFEAATELQIRSLCWDICVNMVANAIGRCEFRTYRDNVEIADREYYLWNIEPNVNQNSTDFLHKLVRSLYAKNEVLIIEGKKHGGLPSLIIADNWDKSSKGPDRQNTYKNVTVGDYTYSRTFAENDVLKLKLNEKNIKSVLDEITNTYTRFINAAASFMEWTQGQHWKVHVGQIAQGADNFTADFTQMIHNQLKPFLTGNAAVLPEFDGYAYSDVRGDRSYQSSNGETATLRHLTDEIFNFTARAFLIPIVLVNGQVEATADANKRFLTNVVDPICDQLQEEINRKRYGYEQWKNGSHLRVDSSTIIHFDLFDAESSIEKVVGSGAFNINEVRKAAGQAPINEPWADRYFLTKNIASVEEGASALDAQKGGDA